MDNIKLWGLDTEGNEKEYSLNNFKEKRVVLYFVQYRSKVRIIGFLAFRKITDFSYKIFEFLQNEVIEK